MEAIGRGLTRRWRDRIDDGPFLMGPLMSHCPIPTSHLHVSGRFFSPLECASSVCLFGVPFRCASSVCLYCRVFASWCLRGRLGGVSPAYQALQTNPGRRQGSPGLGQGFSCVHIAGSQALASRWCAGRHSQRVPSPSRPRLATHVTLIALVTAIEAALVRRPSSACQHQLKRVFYKTAEATAALPAKRCISGGQGFRVAGGGRWWQAVAGGGRRW